MRRPESFSGTGGAAAHPRGVANLKTAYLAGGCFWCLEAVFLRLKGVEKVESGYMGGHVPNPTYRQVCGGDTGHAEAIRLTYDEDQISYPELLDVFFTIHDPTTLNRQGNDVGTQYRSAIYYLSEEQKGDADKAIREAAAHWHDSIVTELKPAGEFYPAEDYHQRYFDINPNQPYCMFVVGPKVEKFQKKYKEKMKG
jgi:peptide-methionine (S)-S-oxide reductase